MSRAEPPTTTITTAASRTTTLSAANSIATVAAAAANKTTACATSKPPAAAERAHQHQHQREPTRAQPPTITTANPYKGVDCLARRRQLSRWLRQVDSGVHQLNIDAGELQVNCAQVSRRAHRQQRVGASGADGESISVDSRACIGAAAAATEHDRVPRAEIDTENEYVDVNYNYIDREQLADQQQVSPPTTYRAAADSRTIPSRSSTWHPAFSKTPKLILQSGRSKSKQLRESNSNPAMATVRPISPQYQHALDSAISLAKELASRNMADSGESSPKTPTSPDKKRFSFKLKHFSKSFSEASANIRDIESSISYEAKQAYKSLIERGPHNSYPSYYNDHHHHQYHHTIGHTHHHQYTNDDFSPSFSNPHHKLKHVSASTFSVKKSLF